MIKIRSTLLPGLLALLATLVAPAASQALPRGFFGIAPQTGLTAQDFGRMRSGGVETIRIPLGWGSVQPTRRADLDWGGFDAFVTEAAKRRLEVLPFLSAPPHWAARAGRLPIDSGAQRRAWAAFVGAAAARYGTRGTFWAEHGPGSGEPVPRLPIRAWQIWNEENFFYFTRPASPRRYARLLKISSRAIHRADPRADVVTGGLFGNPKERPPRAMDAADFLDGLYRAGAKGSFDAVALHPYAKDSRELRRLVEGVRGTMLRHGDRRSGLYITEMGWGSQYDPRVVAFEVGLRGQARELRSSYRYLIGNHRRLGLRQVDWFSWKDARLCSFCDSTGLFREGARFHPKPAWRAFVSFARRR